MLNEKIARLINHQVNQEFYSAYLYLHFSNYFTEHSLDGFANWYKIQAQEERDHAMLFSRYLHDNGAAVTLDAIPSPVVSCPPQDHLSVLKAALAHEESVTRLINEIYSQAHDSRDFRTMEFLNWFVKEQCEEENTARELVAKMELFGSDPRSLYLLNSELASRQYTPAAQG